VGSYSPREFTGPLHSPGAHRSTLTNSNFSIRMRLNRFLASAGLGSRRGVEEIIQSGQVRINGRVITDLATQVEPTDAVKVGNRLIRSERLIHAILHKPKGFLCTADDERERRTIFDLLPANWPRVFHVGRLDKESEGLLIVTNDGDLSLHLTHPRFKMEKEYEVGLDRPFDPIHRDKLLRGMHIQGGWAKAEHISQLGSKALCVVLRQGIKRQIRLMFKELEYEVTHLRRLRIGPVALGNLSPGEWRLLSAKEVALLKKDPVEAPPKKASAPKQ
jgi:23S rRNA pseudouridine2605 synthase